METINILVGEKHYKVELAQTEVEKETGLQGKSTLEPNTGMLFIFSEDDMIGEVGMWMKDTSIPLDIVFIDKELNVTSVKQGVPKSETILEFPETAYVLEVNLNSGIKVGDELEFSPKDKQVKQNISKMLVLNSGGEVQMELEGEERIFSRANTKTLLKFAKKAATTNNDNDYKNVGKRVFKFLEIQEETTPEYVKSKK